MSVASARFHAVSVRSSVFRSPWRVSLCISSFWMSPGRVWIRMVPSWLSLALQRKRRDGAAVIVSSHRFADLANVGSRYAVLHHGTVVDVPAEDGVAAALVGEGLTAAYHRVTKGAP